MSQIRGGADFKTNVFAEAESDEARMPIPAIADGRLGDVGGLRAVGRQGLALGRGVDQDLKEAAGRGIGEVQFEGRAQAGVGEHTMTGDEELGVVIETATREDEAFTGGELNGGNGRAVEPEEGFEAIVGANVLTEVDVR
jgi:hypothetical protein